MFVTVNAQPTMRKTQVSYRESSLFSVLTSQQLLTGYRQQLTRKIEQLVAVPPQHYEDVYAKLITNFAEYVQIIPLTLGGQLGEILQNGLMRGLTAVKIYMDEISDEPDPLYVYAAFSAALLQDLRYLLVDKKVILSNAQGRCLDEWHPLSGSMVKLKQHFYKLRSYDYPINSVSTTVTLVLATKHVMPDIGLLWIAEDQEIFKKWLAALSGDYEGAGRLGDLLLLVKQRLAQQPSIGYDVPINVEITEPQEVADGEAFMAWLKENLNYVDENGVVDAAALEKFTKENPRHADAKKIIKQLSELGVIARETAATTRNAEANIADKKTENPAQRESKIVQKNLLKQTLLGNKQPASPPSKHTTSTLFSNPVKDSHNIAKANLKQEVVLQATAHLDNIRVVSAFLAGKHSKAPEQNSRPSAIERFERLEKIKALETHDSSQNAPSHSHRGSR